MFKRSAALALVLIAAVTPAVADPVSDFYKGKNIQLIVGYGPGGGYDVYARLIARFIGKHVPGGPNVVVQNMPGAGSLRAANYLYVTAPRDGTVFGTFARNMPLLGVLQDNPNVQFDPRKFTWVRPPAPKMMPTCCLPTRTPPSNPPPICSRRTARRWCWAARRKVPPAMMSPSC